MGFREASRSLAHSAGSYLIVALQAAHVRSRQYCLFVWVLKGLLQADAEAIG